MSTEEQLRARVAGVLIGTAVGDALGLPAEGLSAGRIQRLWKGQWQHRFCLGRGMISDDTEHTLFVAQSLIVSPDNVEAFQRTLAWRLRFWLLGMPAGIGLATGRAIIKLWMGFPPGKSGVFSAGNGPAMRSAIIGAYFFDQTDKISPFVSASTRITHLDPKAEIGAWAIAHIVAWEIGHGGEPEGVFTKLRSAGDSEWATLMKKLEAAYRAKCSVADFAKEIGCERGISGYIYQTVPVAIFAWLRHYGNYRESLEAVLNCGGDTDTVGAITGALAGATVGVAGIPVEWRNGVAEWPRSLDLLERVANTLARRKHSSQRLRPVPYFWPGLLLRNVFFLVLVLMHGFRRLVPPY